MSSVVGPFEAIVHAFELRTFPNENGETTRYDITANVLDEDAIASIRATLETVAKAKNVIYTELPYPPVQAADVAEAEGITEGVVLKATYRVDAKHQSPFTLDGRTAADPELNNGIELRMVTGRKVKLAVQFSGRPPRAEAVHRGDRTYAAKPAGEMYCNIIAVMPLDEVVEIGNAIEGLDWGDDGNVMQVENGGLPLDPPADETKEPDIPF